MKPGWKTSEFWLSMVAVVLSGMFASGAIPTDSWINSAMGVAASILAALGYQVSRTLVKKSDSDPQPKP